MDEKMINVRIVLKHDVESNWELATEFIPMAGEVIIYDIDNNYNYERIKIGDGTRNVNALPFVDDALREAIVANYYTKEEIDAYEFITVEDIDDICGGTIQSASEVTF